MTSRPPDLKAFLEDLHAGLNRAADRTGRTYQQIRREFLVERLLARISTADHDQRWVLKGGAGLQLRLDNSRHPEKKLDLDLDYRARDLAGAVGDLQRCAVTPGLDPLEYRVDAVRPRGEYKAQVEVGVYLGEQRRAWIPIDLVVGREPEGTVEHITPRPVVEMDHISPAPRIQLFPLAGQIADKLGGMYREPPQQAIRSKDIVDLALIVTSSRIDAEELVQALRREQQRRRTPLPTRLEPPNAAFTEGYLKAAGSVPDLSPQLRSVEGALEAARPCLDPILNGTMTTGTWNPRRGQWLERTPTFATAAGIPERLTPQNAGRHSGLIPHLQPTVEPGTTPRSSSPIDLQRPDINDYHVHLTPTVEMAPRFDEPEIGF